VLHLKDLQTLTVGKKVTERGRSKVEEFEGPLGGGTWCVRHTRIAPTSGEDYSRMVQSVNNYYKWFVCKRMREQKGNVLPKVDATLKAPALPSWGRGARSD